MVYSPQELSYIEELEEKVDQLEDICCEYAKTVAEKDLSIKALNLTINNLKKLINEIA